MFPFGSRMMNFTVFMLIITDNQWHSDRLYGPTIYSYLCICVLFNIGCDPVLKILNQSWEVKMNVIGNWIEFKYELIT
jgi:hypothetical protein